MPVVRWGIMSTAKIARESIIPAIRQSHYGRVDAVASRDSAKSAEIANTFSIPKQYGSYEDLLSDPDIDAVYIPLPNHLHVEWSVKALEHGKHVLCEKPISPSVSETRKLIDYAKSKPHLKIMEAFMYKFHPQWKKTREIIQEGGIGELRAIQSIFSFYDTDPKGIFNIKEFGGGSLLDIGCYSVSLSRFLFEAEPFRVCGFMDFDPQFKTDRLTAGMMEFEKGTSVFSCSTQMDLLQRVLIVGTKGSIGIEMPFNPPESGLCKIWLEKNNIREAITFDACNQYALQIDSFSASILQNIDVPVPIEESLANMKVIEALFSSARLGAIEKISGN